MSRAERLRRREHARGRKIVITQHDVRLENGVETTLDVIEHPGAAAMVPVDDDGKVLLLQQYRYAVGEDLWEVPAGTLDDGEDPLVCAQRELAEEAGQQATTWTALGDIVTVPGFCDERIWVFLAQGLSAAEAEADVDELIHGVQAFTWDEVDGLVRDGKLHDAKTLAALFKARLHLQA